MAETQKPPQIEYIQAPEGVFQTYANNVAFGSSQFDVRLIFGEMIEGTPEKLRVVTRAQIIMSWLQAKSLARFLQAHIESFERTNGKLIAPKLPAPIILADPFGD